MRTNSKQIIDNLKSGKEVADALKVVTPGEGRYEGVTHEDVDQLVDRYVDLSVRHAELLDYGRTANRGALKTAGGVTLRAAFMVALFKLGRNRPVAAGALTFAWAQRTRGSRATSGPDEAARPAHRRADHAGAPARAAPAGADLRRLHAPAVVGRGDAAPRARLLPALRAVADLLLLAARAARRAPLDAARSGRAGRAPDGEGPTMKVEPAAGGVTVEGGDVLRELAKAIGELAELSSGEGDGSLAKLLEDAAAHPDIAALQLAIPVEDVLSRLDRFAHEADAQVTIARHPGNEPAVRWSIEAVWGREAPDSDMAGAAAYGTGTAARIAITQAVEEAGA
jgi:hypothetical protein